MISHYIGQKFGGFQFTDKTIFGNIALRIRLFLTSVLRSTDTFIGYLAWFGVVGENSTFLFVSLRHIIQL